MQSAKFWQRIVVALSSIGELATQNITFSDVKELFEHRLHFSLTVQYNTFRCSEGSYTVFRKLLVIRQCSIKLQQLNKIRILHGLHSWAQLTNNVASANR